MLSDSLYSFELASFNVDGCFIRPHCNLSSIVSGLTFEIYFLEFEHTYVTILWGFQILLVIILVVFMIGDQY